MMHINMCYGLTKRMLSVSIHGLSVKLIIILSASIDSMFDCSLHRQNIKYSNTYAKVLYRDILGTDRGHMGTYIIKKLLGNEMRAFIFTQVRSAYFKTFKVQLI